MKKYIFLILSVCALIFGINAYAEDTYTEDNFRKMTVDGFETDFSDGNTFFKSSKDGKAPDDVVVVDFDNDEDGHGKVLKITNGKDGKYKSEATQKGFGTKEQSVVVIEHDWYFEAEGPDEASWEHIINAKMGEFFPYKINDTGSWAMGFILGTDGKVTFKDRISGEVCTLMQLEFNRWMHIKLVFDLRDDTISTYVDGNPVAEGVRMIAATSDVKYIQYFCMKLYVAGTENLYHWYVDNAKHYLLYPKYTVEGTYEDKDGNVIENSDSVPYTYSKIRLEFSEAMKPENITSSNIVIKDSENNVVNHTGVFDETENVYIMELDNILSPDTQYFIEISDAVVTVKNAGCVSGDSIGFRTKKTPVGIDSVSLDMGSLSSYEPNSPVEVSVSLRDEFDAHPDVRIIVGIVNENSMTVSVNVCKAEAIENGEVVNLTLKTPGDIADGAYKLNVIMTSGGNIWAPYESCTLE